jgi:hypothetical protein
MVSAEKLSMMDGRIKFKERRGRISNTMPFPQSFRRIVYRTEMLAQRVRFASQPADLPVLLGISFPKSGTHLLDQILLGFSKVAPYSKRLHSFYAEYEAESGQKRSPKQALAWLDSLRPGDIASAHLFARPEAVTRVTTFKVVPYFIFRDPRDVVVSHVFYDRDGNATRPSSVLHLFAGFQCSTHSQYFRQTGSRGGIPRYSYTLRAVFGMARLPGSVSDPF